MNLLQSLPLLLKLLLRISFILINNVYVIPAYMITTAVLRYFLRPKNPASYYNIEGILFHWMVVHVAFWMKAAGYEVVESGAVIEDVIDDEALVVANHQSTGDVPILFYLTQAKREVCNNILWIQDKLFQFTNFGLVSMVHGDFFIQQGKDTRHLQGKLLYEHIRDIYVPRNRKWIVLFPEGGFLRKRRVASKEYARKNGYPVLEHVTLPRLGAIQTLLGALSPQGLAAQDKSAQIPGVKPLRWLIDITIGYPEQKPLDLQNVISGTREPMNSYVHFRKWPITDLPLEQEELAKWLYQRWQEKEQLLEHFYATGHFPSTNFSGLDNREVNNHTRKERIVPFDFSLLFFTHIFYMLLTWFQYKVISTIYYFFATVFSFFI